jgi:thiamine biosynthesis lipoprotein
MTMPAPRAERSFACFGGRAGVLVEGTSTEGRVAALAALLGQAQLHDVHRRLSRFEPGSELSRLNADPAAVVVASRLLRRLAHAVVEAGERSGGLVDATRLRALRRAGYAGSRAGQPGLALADVVRDAPAPRPAGPHPDRPWATIVVDDRARTIARPPGLLIDGGGLAKGLAADLLATTLAGHPAFAIDCAGDVRIGGRAGRERTVLVEDPFDPAAPPLHALRMSAGAAATSGIGRRSWRAADGTPAHHLIDPATERPAWTGVVQATAFAPTALEAEILAKTALLSGPQDGRGVLEHGGVLVLADGTVDVVEALVGQAA